MILTVTINASVDITYVMDSFHINETNRVSNIKKTAGGKGLNVTRVLNQVGADVCASGIIGGSTGSFIERQLNEQNIKHAFYRANSESRNNISIVQGINQTEILESGPDISGADLTGFLGLFERVMEKSGTITMSGSFPPGLPPDYYSRLIQCANRKNKVVLLDTSGAVLAASLRSRVKPTLIKPNQNELAALLGKKIDPGDMEGLTQELSSELFSGIEWVVLSLGRSGALVKKGDQFYRATVPDVCIVNSIGSGDSVIAGFALGIDRGCSAEEVIHQGMLFGVLNALEEHPGCLNLDAAESVGKAIRIEKI